MTAPIPWRAECPRCLADVANDLVTALDLAARSVCDSDPLKERFRQLQEQFADARGSAPDPTDADPIPCLIPCGEGFLFVGACSDSCGSPYIAEGDPRLGHECCSTVAHEFVRLRKRLALLEGLRIEAAALVERLHGQDVVQRLAIALDLVNGGTR